MNKDFKILQAAYFFSNLADGIRLAIFPLLVAQLTNSAWVVGLVAAAGSLPWLLFAIPAGAYIDKKGPFSIMVMANLYRAIILLIFLSFFVFDLHYYVVAMVALILGIFEVFSDTSGTTLLPKVVSKDTLMQANGRLHIIETIVNKLAGAPIGAALFVLGSSIPFVTIAVLYFFTFIIIRIVKSNLAKDDSAELNSTGVNKTPLNIWEGARFILKNRILLILASVTGLSNFALSGNGAILVLFITKHLGGSELEYGLAFTCLSIGALLAANYIPKLKRNVKEAIVLRSVLITFPICLFTMGMSINVFMVFAVMGLLGFTVTAWGIIAVAYRQEVTPFSILGRVNAVYRTVAFGSVPLGSLLAGILAEFFGFSITYMIIGALTLISCFFLSWINQSSLDDLREVAKQSS